MEPKQHIQIQAEKNVLCQPSTSLNISGESKKKENQTLIQKDEFLLQPGGSQEKGFVSKENLTRARFQALFNITGISYRL